MAGGDEDAEGRQACEVSRGVSNRLAAKSCERMLNCDAREA